MYEQFQAIFKWTVSITVTDVIDISAYPKDDRILLVSDLEREFYG